MCVWGGGSSSGQGLIVGVCVCGQGEASIFVSNKCF